MFRKIEKEILRQFRDGSQTEYGEPQAWLRLDNGRTIEVTLECKDMHPWDYYYSIRLHCSEDEFAQGLYKDTMGVISTKITSDLDIKNDVAREVAFIGIEGNFNNIIWN